MIVRWKRLMCNARDDSWYQEDHERKFLTTEEAFHFVNRDLRLDNCVDAIELINDDEVQGAS